MKTLKTILSTATILIFTQSYSQNILIADNNPGAPTGDHVYNTLADAITNAVAGDIIHVIPSATTYGTVEVTEANDSISIIGIGFNPDKDGPQLSEVDIVRISGSGIRIAGLYISNQLYIGYNNGNYSGLSIENSDIRYILSNSSAAFSMSNVILRNCLIQNQTLISSSGISLSNRVNNSIITNNIILGYASTGGTGAVSAYNGTIIKNNIFYGTGEADEYGFEVLENCTVTNNIFFGRNPAARTSIINTVFNNNVSVGNTDNTLPPVGTNITGVDNVTTLTDETLVFGDGNIVIGTSWELDWDPTPTNGLLLGTGSDGTDIGVTGGSIPFDITGTPLPYIQQFLVPEVIRQGTDLDVTVKAIGN